MGYKIIELQPKGDLNGSLIAIESLKDIDFDIKRVYYVYGSNPDVVRGKHAHKKLKQLIVCVSGSCDFVLDNGKQRETIHLNSPTQGLYISNVIWREFTRFSPDCVVMVLASEHYDTSDYIHEYAEFLHTRSYLK